MASIAVHLRSRPGSFLRASSSSSSHSHLFSSSSSPPDFNDGSPQNSDNTQSNSNSSSLSDMKFHLIDRQPSQQQPPRNPYFFSQYARSPLNRPSAVSMDEIQNNLKEFRLRTALPAPPSNGVQPISLQELYKKSISESGSSDRASSPEYTMASIKEHLLRTKSPEGEGLKPGSPSFSLPKLKERLRPVKEVTNAAGSRVIGGTSEGFPLRVFGKELSAEDETSTSTELVKGYTFDELGERLRELRPEGVKKQGENWFSLSELNERLVKLREIEKKEEAKGEKNIYSVQRVDVLSSLGGTPNYMSTPPKEHLFEKSPDNMSSAEKLKLELKRVKDEFKMSETDCGSTRVQIAQLTTEISHLSKVLHKKDKHSRKGLIAKVQLRKKLPKYLRRTDWDSYCFILSKLGLRDNPGHKQ